ncbi:alpha-E domain-containing protein [Aeromicrobium sp. UC242_57]|uniref:alpha-E domain-containing protein n=1 Tax=Aeromicrobium sp. UC242_57 TaxID=3374624 RepID=UPI0037A8EEC2
MLSRIAQSLFWIGRYLERADDTARILDVQMQVLVEDPAWTSARRASSCCPSWASSTTRASPTGG